MVEELHLSTVRGEPSGLPVRAFMVKTISGAALPSLPLNSWASYSFVIHRKRLWIGGGRCDVSVVKQLPEEKMER